MESIAEGRIFGKIPIYWYSILRFNTHPSMSHPHEYILKEYQYAINHLAPTVPAEIKAEAQKTCEALLTDPNTDEKRISEAMATTGKAEYPYRYAYNELTGLTKLEKLKEHVLEHVDDAVKKKLEDILASGANIEEITRSKMFEEQFNADEKYQIEDGFMDAEEHVKEEMKELSEKDLPKYDKLVKKYEGQRDEIQKQIDILRALASHDKKWEAEILDKVKNFEEGWLVTMPDPKLETVKKEIEYWQGVFGEE